MFIERKENLSIIYWLKDKFSSTSFVTIVDGFPESDLKIPSISAEWDTIDVEDIQLGDRTGARYRTWNLDVFAKNKSQRDEFSYKILNDLKDGIPVYDYDLGIPSTTKIGHLNIIKKRADVVTIDPELVSSMYYRATVTILATNDILGG